MEEREPHYIQINRLHSNIYDVIIVELGGSKSFFHRVPSERVLEILIGRLGEDENTVILG